MAEFFLSQFSGKFSGKIDANQICKANSCGLGRKSSSSSDGQCAGVPSGHWTFSVGIFRAIFTVAIADVLALNISGTLNIPFMFSSICSAEDADVMCVTHPLRPCRIGSDIIAPVANKSDDFRPPVLFCPFAWHWAPSFSVGDFVGAG